jgi:hypothetical protein
MLTQICGLSSRATDEAESVKGSDDFNSEEGNSLIKRINKTTSFHDNEIRLICEWHENSPINKKDFLAKDKDILFLLKDEILFKFKTCVEFKVAS